VARPAALIRGQPIPTPCFFKSFIYPFGVYKGRTTPAIRALPPGDGLSGAASCGWSALLARATFDRTATRAVVRRRFAFELLVRCVRCNNGLLLTAPQLARPGRRAAGPREAPCLPVRLRRDVFVAARSPGVHSRIRLPVRDGSRHPPHPEGGTERTRRVREGRGTNEASPSEMQGVGPFEEPRRRLGERSEPRLEGRAKRVLRCKHWNGANAVSEVKRAASPGTRTDRGLANC
jgi:hypothetical protein